MHATVFDTMGSHSCTEYLLGSSLLFTRYVALRPKHRRVWTSLEECKGSRTVSDESSVR